MFYHSFAKKKIPDKMAFKIRKNEKLSGLISILKHISCRQKKFLYINI